MTSCRKEYNSIYYINNADKCKENAHNYYLMHRERILAKRKKQYVDTSDIRRNQYLEWRSKNPMVSKEKIECECGKMYTIGHKTRHLESKLHKKRLEGKGLIV